MQLVTWVAAECSCEDSAGHVSHAAEPTEFLCLPAGQAVHVSPSSPVYPGLHEQAVLTVDVAGEMAFGSHSVHSALPGCVL